MPSLVSPPNPLSLLLGPAASAREPGSSYVTEFEQLSKQDLLAHGLWGSGLPPRAARVGTVL